jgi:hypothetical protein
MHEDTGPGARRYRPLAHGYMASKPVVSLSLPDFDTDTSLPKVLTKHCKWHHWDLGRFRCVDLAVSTTLPSFLSGVNENAEF